MIVLIVALLVILLLFGVGFAAHALWWIALIALIVWLVGFVVRSTDSAGTRARWYRW